LRSKEQKNHSGAYGHFDPIVASQVQQ